MGDAAIAILLLDKFEKQLHTDILEIERQVAAGSAGEIARTAHSLKGAAGALASQPLRDCAARLEALARDNHLDSIARELSSLRAEVDRYLAYLPTTREELKHTTPGTSAGTEAGQ
jgi:HPt (histidine-containing phosphotransfer) domain-containing protein